MEVSFITASPTFHVSCWSAIQCTVCQYLIEPKDCFSICTRCLALLIGQVCFWFRWNVCGMWWKTASDAEKVGSSNLVWITSDFGHNSQTSSFMAVKSPSSCSSNFRVPCVGENYSESISAAYSVKLHWSSFYSHMYSIQNISLVIVINWSWLAILGLMRCYDLTDLLVIFPKTRNNLSL